MLFLKVCIGMRILISCTLFLGEFWPHTLLKDKSLSIILHHEFNDTNCIQV